MYEETTEKLLEFISKSPTAFQAAEETRRRFLEEGFTELKEEERWELEKGGKYFVMRNHSAIIGFSIPVNDCRRYHIIASHSDSPSPFCGRPHDRPQKRKNSGKACRY